MAASMRCDAHIGCDARGGCDAHPIEVTSLARTADGRQLSLDGRVPGETHAAFSSNPKHPTRHDGPRSDARPTSSLPLLVEGRDALPTSCSSCGGAMLDRREARDGHMVGGIWCSTCSEQLCWLSRPLRAIPTARSIQAQAQAPLPQVARDADRPRVRTGRFERLDGCGVLCLPEYGHDARTHEVHGGDRVLADLAARRTGRVSTGRLVVDFDLDCVTLGGRELALPGTQRALLLLLADRLGATIRYDAVAAGVWGAAALSADDGGERHHLRVLVARVRARLGPAADLVQTVPCLGLRLRADPPIATEDLRR